MLNIESVNHVGIRIKDKTRSVAFYELLGFEFDTDAGFDDGHPIIMKHPSGVVLNLLGPANTSGDSNILMDVDDKHTGSFSFGNMSAIFVRDPDRNVIELDAYDCGESTEDTGYSDHP